MIQSDVLYSPQKRVASPVCIVKGTPKIRTNLVNHLDEAELCLHARIKALLCIYNFN